MPNSTEITRLRKEGKLDEAHALALETMAANPDDIWNRRAYAWVLHALIKRCLANEQVPEARVHFSTFLAMNMPAEETLLFENFNHFRLRIHPQGIKAEKLSRQKKYREALNAWWTVYQEEEELKTLPDLHFKIAWEIWHNLKTLQAASSANLKLLETWTQLYRQLDFLPKPSLPHSMVLNQLLRLPEPLRQSFPFLDWFRFWQIPGDFTEKDWQPYVTQEKKLPSLAERACNAWCRALIKEGRFLREEEVANALTRLEAIADAHPEFIWLPYFTAKIRLVTSTGSPEETRIRLIPFVQSKHTEFWAWDLLADTFPPQEADEIEACLCKALSCQADPKYLVKVRARLAEIRRKKGIPEDAPLEKGVQTAEALVFADRQCAGTAVIEGIDRNTGAVYFAMSRDVRGRFPSRKFPNLSFHLGDLFNLKLLRVEKQEKKFWEVLSAEPTKDTPLEEVCRVFSGKFEQKKGQSFGFVEEVFVPPPLVRQYDLSDGREIAVTAVWALDSRKNQYGWKCVRIDP